MNTVYLPDLTSLPWLSLPSHLSVYFPAERVALEYAERITVTELPDQEKTPVLREYLRRWSWEVGAFFEGIDKNATDADLSGISGDFPVFRVLTA